MKASQEIHKPNIADQRERDAPIPRQNPAPLVLVVEDEPDVRLLISTVLKCAGMEAVEVSDGASVLKLLDGHSGAIDVLVMDVQLPDQDGFTLLRDIKQRHPRIPIVMITGHGSITDAVEAIRQGAANYLSKPLQITEFVEIVRRAVKLRQSSRDEERKASGIRLGRAPFASLPPMLPKNLPPMPPTNRAVTKDPPSVRVSAFVGRCSGCLSNEASESSVHGMEYLLVLLLLRPFRCLVCDRRFWRCWVLDKSGSALNALMKSWRSDRGVRRREVNAPDAEPAKSTPKDGTAIQT